MSNEKDQKEAPAPEKKKARRLPPLIKGHITHRLGVHQGQRV